MDSRGSEQAQVKDMLFSAVQSGSVEIFARAMSTALNAGLSVDINWCAANNPSVEILTAKTSFLHAAVEKGSLAMVELLLGYLPKLDEADTMGRTPLSIAAGKGRVDIMTALHLAGAQVNAAGSMQNVLFVDCMTALHAAAGKGQLGSMRYLLDHGANINVKKVQRSNSVGSASELVTLLVFSAANNDSEETALDIVRRMEHPAAEAFLLSCGALTASDIVLRTSTLN
jgi:ankyrin repeat protein